MNNNRKNSKNQKAERPKLQLLQRSSSAKSSVDRRNVSESMSPPISPIASDNISVNALGSEAWPQEKVDRDLTSSLNEYLAISNIDELILNLRELQAKSGVKDVGVAFTKRLFNLFLDKKDTDRQNFTQLMLTLLADKSKEKDAICTIKNFLQALKEFAVELPDLKFDAPKCDEWLSSLFGMMIAEGLVDTVNIKMALKPVLDDPYSGQMVGTFAYGITKTIADNYDGDATTLMESKGLRILYRRGLSWAFKMHKMGAAERFLENSKPLLKALAPGLWLSTEFFNQKVILKQDVPSLSAWLEQSLQSLQSGGDMDDELQDLSYGFTAAIMANMPRKVEDLSELLKYVDILKSIVNSDVDASTNGCTDAITDASGVNNWKPVDEDVIFDKLVEVGVLLKKSVDFIKEFR